MQVTATLPRRTSPFVASLIGALGTFVVAAVAVVTLNFGSQVVVSLSAQAAIVAMLALGVGVLNRVLGLVSFGHAAPFGFGAYGTAIALAGGGLPPELGISLVLVGGFIAFFAIGLVVIRVDGIAFAMLTLAIGQAGFVAATKFRGLTGGADGLMLRMPRRLFGVDTAILQQPNGMLAVAIGALAVVYVVLRWFERSHWGRLAIAIRENEERARFLGFRTHALRAAVYAVSCGLACLGGVLFVLYQGFVSPEILHWSYSGSALIMAILGGSAFLWGPIVGACVFFLVRDALSDITSHWLAILGASLIIVMVVWPTGLSGAAETIRDKILPRKKAEDR